MSDNAQVLGFEEKETKTTVSQYTNNNTQQQTTHTENMLKTRRLSRLVF
jgi:hypothetical protein